MSTRLAGGPNEKAQSLRIADYSVGERALEEFKKTDMVEKEK